MWCCVCGFSSRRLETNPGSRERPPASLAPLLNCKSCIVAGFSSTTVSTCCTPSTKNRWLSHIWATSGLAANGSSAGLWAVVKYRSLSESLHDVEQIRAKLLEDKRCCCKASGIQSNYSKLSHLPLALSLTKLSEEFQVMGFHFKSPILDLFHGFIVVLPPGSVLILFSVSLFKSIHSLNPEPEPSL